MAKAGRKRKPMGTAQRNQTTAEGQGRKQKATPERLAHYKAATGRKRHNNMDAGDASALDLLHGAKLITETQMTAAKNYAELHQMYTGAFSFEKREVPFYKHLSGNGSVASLTEDTDAFMEKKEIEFQKAHALLKCPKVKKVIYDVVVCDFIPQFFINLRNHVENTMEDLKQMALLRQGLNKLIGR